jgi:hypothetical protein
MRLSTAPSLAFLHQKKPPLALAVRLLLGAHGLVPYYFPGKLRFTGGQGKHKRTPLPRNTLTLNPNPSIEFFYDMLDNRQT